MSNPVENENIIPETYICKVCNSKFNDYIENCPDCGNKIHTVKHISVGGAITPTGSLNIRTLKEVIKFEIYSCIILIILSCLSLAVALIDTDRIFAIYVSILIQALTFVISFHAFTKVKEFGPIEKVK